MCAEEQTLPWMGIKNLNMANAREPSVTPKMISKTGSEVFQRAEVNPSVG